VGEGLVNDIPFYLKVGLMVVFLVVSVSRLLRDSFWLVNYYLEKIEYVNCPFRSKYGGMSWSRRYHHLIVNWVTVFIDYACFLFHLGGRENYLPNIIEGEKGLVPGKTKLGLKISLEFQVSLNKAEK
jgi:hypothetical protein